MVKVIYTHDPHTMITRVYKIINQHDP